MSTSTAGFVAEPAVIDVKDLSKRYNLYRSSSHRLACMLGLSRSSAEKMAIRNVSFAVREGEMIGLVGSNGAGKSTLLKLIAGATRPTSGSVTCRGRIAAVLELGIGFHPEWTGRQNVEYYLRLQGLRQRDVQKLMPQIEEFADIDAYFDQPLRTCSSGMAMRVSFAAAALVPCETLIVDEALVIGDARFAHKCYDHIAGLRRRGVTIFFVTHRLDLVTQLCSRALFLHKGALVFDGKPDDAVRLYYEHVFAGDNPAEPPTSTVANNSFGSGGAAITAVRLDRRGAAPPGSKALLNVEVQFEQPSDQPVFSLLLKTVEGVLLYQTNSDLLGSTIGPVAARSKLSLQIMIPLYFSASSVLVDLAIAEYSESGLQFLHAMASCVEIEIAGPVRSFGLVNLDATMSFTLGNPAL